MCKKQRDRMYRSTYIKWPVYIFAFVKYNSKQVNVSVAFKFSQNAEFLALNLCKVMLNVANIYLFGVILTKCKYTYIQVFSNISMDRQTHWYIDRHIYCKVAIDRCTKSWQKDRCNYI